MQRLDQIRISLDWLLGLAALSCFKPLSDCLMWKSLDYIWTSVLSIRIILILCFFIYYYEFHTGIKKVKKKTTNSKYF